MFDDRTNERLREEIDVAAIQKDLETEFPNALFAVTFSVSHDSCQNMEDSDNRIVYSQGPPTFFGYRHQGRNRGSSSFLEPECYMNDMVLLRLSREDAELVSKELKKSSLSQTTIVSIQTLPQLQSYIQPKADKPKFIRVKNMDGQLLTNRLSARNLIEDGQPLQLLFTLHEGYV